MSDIRFAKDDVHPLPPHSTTVYKVQEAFNNVTLPDENVYKTAIEAVLCATS